MKKLLTILAIATLISCSKEPIEEITECDCWNFVMTNEFDFWTTMLYEYEINSTCSNHQQVYFSNFIYYGEHCFDEPKEYE